MDNGQQHKEAPLLLLPTTEEFFRVSIYHKLSVIASLAGRLQTTEQRDKIGQVDFGSKEPPQDKKLSEFCRMISISPAFNIVARSARKLVLKDVMDSAEFLSTLQNWDYHRKSDMDYVARQICLSNAAAWESMTGIPCNIPTIEFESLDNSYGQLSRGTEPRTAKMTLNPNPRFTKDPAEFCNTVLHEDLHARGVDFADTYDYFPDIDLGVFESDAEVFSALFKTNAILPSKLGHTYRAQFHERLSFHHGDAFGADIRKWLKAERKNSRAPACDLG